jgi:hypothetical protein
MTLETAAANLGKKVLYHVQTSGCEPGCNCTEEAGVITSVNHRYVFVRYGDDGSSLATPAEFLTLAGEQ